MRKHLLIVFLVSFCSISGFAAAQPNQDAMKASYLRAKKRYFKDLTFDSQEQRFLREYNEKSTHQRHNQKPSALKKLWKSLTHRNELPTAGSQFFATPISSGAFPLYEFHTEEELHDSDGQVTYVQWDFGDGTHMEIPAEELHPQANMEHVFPLAGTYTVTFRVFDDSNEFSELSQTVNVTENQIPAPFFTYVKTTGNNVNFTATANDPENSVASYEWSFGDNSPGLTLTGNTASHSFPGPGIYEVALKVTDSAGAVAFFTKHVYVRVVLPTTIPPYPVVKYSATVGNAPLTENFDASLSVDSRDRALTIFEWDFGDYSSSNNFSRAAVASHLYHSPGTFFGRLKITDRYGNATNEYFRVMVKADQPLTPFIVARHDDDSRNIRFDGDSANMRATFEPEQVHWDFGDGTLGQGPWAEHKYPVDGKYTVRAVINDVQGRRHVTLHDITVVNHQDSPEAHMNIDDSYGFIGDSFHYRSNDSHDNQQNEPLTFSWSFADGEVLLDQANPEADHAFSAKGYYLTKVFVTNSRGMMADAGADITVQDGSQIRGRPYYTPKIGNAPLHTSFKADFAWSQNSTIVKSYWEFSDGTYSEQGTVSKVFADPGHYWAKLFVRDGLGNESVDFREIYVLNPYETPGNNEPPVAYFDIERASDGPGDMIFKAFGTFDPDGEPKFLEWRVDNVLKLDEWTYDQYFPPGEHSVRLTVYDQWKGTTSLTKTFKVGETWDAFLSFNWTPSSPTASQVVTFDASATVVTGLEYKKFRWDFGDGVFGSGLTATHTYTAAGTYSVKLLITDLDSHDHILTQSVTVQ